MTVYTRDALGRLTSETDALGRTTSTTYDKLGRPSVVTAVDASVTATSYTPDGLVAKVARPDQTVTYAYDAVGNRLTMKDKLGTSSWAYDWAGRVVSETDARGNTTTRAYDLAGNLAGVAYADGRTVARTFDRRGLTVSQTDTTVAGASSVTTFGYDEAGALTGQVRSSGVVTRIDRDLAGRVTSIEYTGVGVTGSMPPSRHGSSSSGAWGSVFGRCVDDGNGYSNHRPDGHSTDTLTFAYAYDVRGLVTQRDVVTDAGTTRTTYAHDALGRLTRSVTGDVGRGGAGKGDGGRGCAGAGSVASVYAWDAASNLVGEGGTDDPSTSKSGDAYAIARTVNAANELVTQVKDPVGTHGGKVETTQFSYDGRGNRTGSVTTTQTGKKTQVESRSTFSYDGMDQLTSTSGPQGSASWARDGGGRALTVKEDGVTSTRLYDGVQVVADGDTQLTLAPNGQVLSETTTTWTVGGKGKCRTGVSVESVDVLTDVLGSAVATASGGVISKDLALYGDFGEALTTPEVDTVTGFTGKVQTAGLVEFASRTYDPSTRLWVQDDRFRGTTTRAASMNRYAYVEGAPESFVDVLGFYRARAAIQAQALAALNAQLQSALASLGGLYGDALKYGQNLSVAQMLKIYDNLNAGLDPQVKAVFDPIVRSLVNQVKDIHAAQKLAQMIADTAARQAREAQERYVKALTYQNIQLKWEAEQRAFQVENESLGIYNAAKFLQGVPKGVWNVAWEVGSIPADVVYTVGKCTEGWTACHTRMGEQFDPIATMWDDYYEVLESGYLTVTGEQSIGEHNAIAYDTFRRYTYGGIIDNLEAGKYYESGESTGELGGSAALVVTPIKYLPKIPKLPASLGDPGATAVEVNAAAIRVGSGTLRTVGAGFSASEIRAATALARSGRDVVLREAPGGVRTSDLLIDGIPYDVYTPKTGSIDRIVSEIASKGSQVRGGGVVLDLSESPLMAAEVGNLLSRVQGVTDQVTDIIIIGGEG